MFEGRVYAYRHSAGSSLGTHWARRAITGYTQQVSAGVDLAWDAFNVLNHVNFEKYNGVLISPTFGQPHTAFPARQLQVSVRYHF